MYVRSNEERETIARAVETSGLSVDQLDRKLWRAAWPVYRLQRELNAEGWLDRLEAAGDAADEERRRLDDAAVDGAVAAIFQTGPSAMVALDPAKRLERLSPKPLRWVAEKYSPSEHGGLLIVGPTGVGKTLSVVHAVDRLARPAFRADLREVQHDVRRDRREIAVRTHAAPPVVWFRSFELGKARRQAPLGEGEAPLVLEAIKAPIAVLDDLGWEDPRDTAIAEIIAERYDAKRPTIVTSGLRPEELEQRYGSALLRRIIDGEPKGRIVNAFPREAMQ
jgi:hypothetical protein